VTVWIQVEEKNMIVPPKKEEIANKKTPEDQSRISIWNSNFKIDDEGGRVRY
jgi:hypothetical protein